MVESQMYWVSLMGGRMTLEGIGVVQQSSKNRGKILILVLIVSSLLYLLLLNGMFFTIPTDGVVGNFIAEGLVVRHLFENQDMPIEKGDVVVQAGERSVDEWANRWLQEWPPTSNPWSSGQSVPFTVRRGTELLSANITLDHLSPAILARRMLGRLQVYTSILFLAVGALVLWRRPHLQAAQ